MSSDLTCSACGYRPGSAAAKRLSGCPRCGTPFAEPSRETTDAAPKDLPFTAEDLSDLEFSDVSVSGDVLADDGRDTNPKPREESGKVITDPQQAESQEEKLELQKHLAAMPKPPVGIHIKTISPAKEIERSAFRIWMSDFGAVFLVCAVFLLWVIYDHVGRGSNTDAILSQAVISYQKGDRQAAQDLVRKALQKDPNSPLAKNLAQLFEERK